jgi:hypothetical protein
MTRRVAAGLRRFKNCPHIGSCEISPTAADADVQVRRLSVDQRCGEPGDVAVVDESVVVRRRSDLAREPWSTCGSRGSVRG